MAEMMDEDEAPKEIVEERTFPDMGLSQKAFLLETTNDTTVAHKNKIKLSLFFQFLHSSSNRH